MPDLPAIAIFADTKAQRAYLSEVVQMAGFSVAQDANSADFGIVAPGQESAPKDLSFITLGTDLSLPIRAAQLIEALHKFSKQQAALPAQLNLGPHILDTRENIFTKNGGEPARLTEKETAILTCLKQAGGSAVSREDLLTRVWSYADGVETHTLETHIYRLRQKIEIDPSQPAILLTEEDGYRLQE